MAMPFSRAPAGQQQHERTIMRPSASVEERVGRKTKEAILQALRADIISQQLKPGQAIREDDLAQRYGISRTPIRELLRRLEQEELVRVVPHHGAFVSELTQKDVEEVLDIRLLLETAAARVAASKITPEQRKVLNDISRVMEAAVRSQDSILSFEADSRLHDLILVAAGNSRARRIISNLMGQILRIRFISGHKPGRINTTVAEHKRIVRALLDNDPEGAERAMRVHLANTRQVLLPSSDMDKKFEEFLRQSFTNSRD